MNAAKHRQRQFRPRAAALAFCVAAAALFSARAEAVPGIKDMWHFFCAPAKVTDKIVAAAKSKTGSGGVKGGIAMLNYACMLELREQEAFVERMSKWQAAGAKGAQPKPSNAASADALKQAASILAAAYNANRKSADAQYWHGLALAVRGDVMAVNVIDELQTQHADSKLAADAALILGEQYFERRDLPKAFREYDNALKKGRPIVQAYTRYKKAWINFGVALDAKNLQKQRVAVNELVNLKQQLTKQKGEKEEKLEKMIETDVADILVAQGDMAEAKRVLTAMKANDVYAGLLERMGNGKLQKNDVAGGAHLFELSLREGPLRPEAFDISSSLVQIAAQKQDMKRITDLLKYMVAQYATDKSKWREANKKDAKLLANASTKVEAMLIDFGVAIDETARKANNPQGLNYAKTLYELHLKTFPKAKKANDVRTQLGQVLFIQKQFLRAAATFEVAIKANPKNPAVKDLLDLMVTSAQSAVDADKTKYPTSDPGQARAEKTIPQVKKVYADCLDLYLKMIPNNPNAAAMSFAAASVYYDFGHFDEAMKRYDAFLTRFAKSEFSRQVAQKMLVYYDAVNNARGLEKAAAKINSLPPLGQAPEIAPLLAKAKTKIEEAKKDGLYDDEPKKGKDPNKKLVSDEESADGAEAEESGGDGDKKVKKKDKKKKEPKKKKKKKKDEEEESVDDEAA